MSRIDELITRVCPHGVELKTLGEIGELVRGSGMPKSEFVVSGVGCIHYGQIYTHYGPWTKETISFVSAETARTLAKVDPGDLIVANTSENVADVCKAVAWLGEMQIVTGGHATVLKHHQNAKYLSYYFQTPNFSEQKKKRAIGAKVTDVSAKALATIRVPVPPLEIQHEIARALDAFVSLDAQLTEELEARRRQYEYDRESLLTFAETEEGRWTTMGDVGTFTRGRRFTKNDLVAEGIGSIHYGDIYTQYGTSATEAVSRVRPDLASSLRFARTGDVVIAAVGETVEDICKAVAWLGDEDVAVHDDCFIFHHSMNPKFVSYYFQTSAFHAEKAKHVARAKVKRISGESLGRLKIPVPPINEQARIVAILDKFDALVNDLSLGLPAELSARQQQYEHYRDRLLTFPEAA